ncbi:hypothetical protein V8C44DRAFT_198333 [Trichoderma aethiopicum]
MTSFCAVCSSFSHHDLHISRTNMLLFGSFVTVLPFVNPNQPRACSFPAEAVAPDAGQLHSSQVCLSSAFCLSCVSSLQLAASPTWRFLQHTLFGIAHHDQDKGPCKVLPSKWTPWLRRKVSLKASMCDSV